MHLSLHIMRVLPFMPVLVWDTRPVDSLTSSTPLRCISIAQTFKCQAHATWEDGQHHWAYQNQECHPSFATHSSSPPLPADADSPRCVAISDLQCPHSKSSDACDMSDLPKRVFNLCSPRRVSYCSVEWIKVLQGPGKQHTLSAELLAVWLVLWRDVSHWLQRKKLRDECHTPETWMSNSHCTTTVFTVIWVRSTKHTVVWKPWVEGGGGSALLCKLWARKAWRGQPMM